MMKKKSLDDTITSFKNDSNFMIESYKYLDEEVIHAFTN